MRNNQPPSIFSIYHNSLPYYLDRADICSLDDEGLEFAARWIADLLKGSVSQQVNASFLAADKIRHLYFETRNFEKTQGAKSFGFGYPLLIDTHESDLLVAPLFTWMLSIEPAQAKVDGWVFRFGADQQILPNYWIFNYLREKYHLDLTAKAEELAFQKKLNAESLDDLLKVITAALKLEIERPERNMQPCPGLEDIGAFTGQAAIFWSGVLGMYPPQPKARSGEIPKPEEVFAPAVLPSHNAFVFPYLVPNPGQASAQEEAARQKISVVESENDAERTPVVVNLLLNAMSNGEKCLVVSERVPALKAAQNALAKTNLHQLHYLLDDALNDKMPMLDSLRVASTNTTRTYPHHEEIFSAKKNKYLREKEKLDAAYSAVKDKIFGNHDWTETVGLFLASNRVEGKELLASQLNSQEYEHNLREYEQIKRGVLSSYPLYQKVKTLNHPLSVLHDDHFRRASPSDSLLFVSRQLSSFLEKASKLHLRYIGETDAYAANLKRHFQAHFEELSGKLQQLKEVLEDYGDTYGDDFRQAGVKIWWLPAFLSKRKRLVREAQQEAGYEYQSLLKAYNAKKYFNFDFIPCNDGRHIPKTTENLEAFSDALHSWYGKLDVLVQEEVSRLNSKTAHPALDCKEQVTDLEFSLDQLLEDLNQSGLFAKPLENKTLTISQRQKFLEGVIEQMEVTQRNLVDFDVYYRWQSNWLTLSPLGHKVIRALVKAKAVNWLAAFESWYFHNLLSKNQNPALPTDDALCASVSAAWYELQPMLMNQIQHSWQLRQMEAVREFKRRDKKHWQLIFEKTGQAAAQSLPLEVILEPAFEAVTSLLPALFVTSHVALNVLPQREGFFDLVIFEEANCLSVEEGAAISKLGKRVVVSGSNGSYGKETSLFQYAKESGAPVSVASLPGYKATEFSEEAHLASVIADNVEGRYHELDGTNDAEAQHVVKLLRQIKQTPQRVYPTVGVVAMTVEQRDLIASYLLKIKQQNAPGSDEILQLERNGMGVFFVDEVYGQPFDLLILSCTFGQVNLKGEMTKKILFLNTHEGVNRISALTQKANHSTTIVHSFPKNWMEKQLQKKQEEGAWLLANWIQLANAVEKGDRASIHGYLEALGKIDAGEGVPTVFAQEAANALLPYLPEERIRSAGALGGVSYPILVAPEHQGGQHAVIVPDGFFGSAGYTNGVWEEHQKTVLQQKGTAYLPVWSLNWLRNPGDEARWLASRLLKKEG